MHAAQHLKRSVGGRRGYILSIKSVISEDIWAHGTAVLCSQRICIMLNEPPFCGDGSPFRHPNYIPALTKSANCTNSDEDANNTIEL